MKIFYLFILITVAMEHCKGNGMKYLLVEIDDGKDAAAKSGGEVDGEVDNVVRSENTDEAVRRCDEDDFRCKNGLESVGEVKRCSGFRCPNLLGGMCLREGASGCSTGEGCCDGLQCHAKTGICMGQGATIIGSNLGWKAGKDGFFRQCECLIDPMCNCPPFQVTRRLKDNQITTMIKMKPGCTECKGSCCDFVSRIEGRNQEPIPVQLQMKPSCTECKGSCCDDVLVSEHDQRIPNAMITYL